jgi:urease accessory protein
LQVELADSASFLGVETLVFGRTAMGETVDRARLRDAISIRRGGRLLLTDAFRLNGDARALLRRPAIAAGAKAMATLWYVAQDAAAALESLRAALVAARTVQCGASAWDGMIVARFLAADAASLRLPVVAVLRALRAGRPVPRVWLC